MLSSKCRRYLGLVLPVAALLLSSCERFGVSEGLAPEGEPAPARPGAVGPPPEAAVSGETERAGEAEELPTRPEYTILRGSGQFIGRDGQTPITIQVGDNGDITLDFADADIRQVVKATLGDILGLNYVIAPDVQGTVTAQTERPLSRDALLPTLESILRLHGAALVLDGAIYRVETLQGAARGRSSIRLQSGGSGAGYGVQVVPLRFISAEDMRETLVPLAGQDTVLHVDQTRNLLFLSGAQPELAALMDAIRLFDVDWLSGMSFGLFPLEFAEAKTLIDELQLILDSQKGGALSGLVRLMPVERMNAVLVVSQQSRYVEEVRRWVQRLDLSTQTATDRQLYIYFVQNARADDIAEVLSQIFGEEDTSQRGEEPSVVAPGLEPVELTSQPPAPTGTQVEAGGQVVAAAPVERMAEQARERPGPSRASRTTQPGAISLAASKGVRIVADVSRNALLISGTPAEYRAVLRALREIDRRPLEVLIEVTIADVTLTDTLRYGVRWFLQSSNARHSLTFSGTTTTDPVPTVPGISYVFTSTNSNFVLDLLASVTDVNVISAPQVLVLNNQPAQLQVGEQVPIATQQSTDTEVGGAAIVSTVELKDIGVILKVTPRVNEGGLVIMEIEQEVSSVAPDAESLTPRISKRNITTTAAVQSGQTVALGGLIQDNKTNTKSGVPGLMHIPILGALFRNTTDTITRSELLVMVTPRVVSDTSEERAITEELRRRISDLERLEAKVYKSVKPAEDEPSE